MLRTLSCVGAAALVLAAASAASATMLVDFGNDPGKTSTLGGGYGTVQTYTFSADTVTWKGTYTGAWQSSGMQVNGLSVPLNTISPTDVLTFDMRWTANSMFNPPTFYKIGVHIYAASGNQSNYFGEYQPGPTANPTPFPGASSANMVTVWGVGTAGAPESTGGSGPLDFATDTISHMDVYIQVGPGDYSNNPITEMELDNIQFQPVPEPASLGLLAAAGVGLLLKRRR